MPANAVVHEQRRSIALLDDTMSPPFPFDEANLAAQKLGADGPPRAAGPLGESISQFQGFSQCRFPKQPLSSILASQSPGRLGAAFFQAMELASIPDCRSTAFQYVHRLDEPDQNHMVTSWMLLV